MVQALGPLPGNRHARLAGALARTLVPAAGKAANPCVPPGCAGERGCLQQGSTQAGGAAWRGKMAADIPTALLGPVVLCLHCRRPAAVCSICELIDRCGDGAQPPEEGVGPAAEGR